MIKKIYNEINEFTESIKDTKGCDEMQTYMSSSIYAAIKLLLFASSTFSIIGRVLLFCIIASTGLLVFSSLGAIAIDMNLLVIISVILQVVIIAFIMHFKNYFASSIQKAKANK